MLKREYFQSRYCHEKIQTVHPYNFYTSGPFDKIIQQIKRRYLINPWLPGEKCKPIIVRDANKALHFVSPRSLNNHFVKSVGLTLFFLILYNLSIVEA